MTVLGAVLMDEEGDAYRVAKAILDPGDFRNKSHGTIFSAMGELHKDSGFIDFLTLQNALRGKEQLEDATTLPVLFDIFLP